MDSDRIPESGCYLAFSVGDLVKISTTRIIDYSQFSYEGKLGIVSGQHTNRRQMVLPFIPIFVFSANEVRYFSPQELEIVSNIDE